MHGVKAQVLAFAGCPNVDEALANVRAAAEGEGVHAFISQLEIDTPELAVTSKFLGSPTVRINGIDVEPGALQRTEYGLMCRTYRSGDHITGAPPVGLIREAIRREHNQSSDILSSWTATVVLYGLPIIAILISGSVGNLGWRTVVWTLALTIMGAACLVNARKCGRVHCFATGPFFLLMGLVTLLYGLGLVPLGKYGWGYIQLATLVGGLILYYVPELLFGKYRREA